MMGFDWESSSGESTEDSLKVKQIRLGKRPSNLGHLKPHIEHGAHQRLTGFGLPGYTPMHRSLPSIAAGPPYFYFENIQCMPGNELNGFRQILQQLISVEIWSGLKCREFGMKLIPTPVATNCFMLLQRRSQEVTALFGSLKVCIDVIS